MPKKSHRISPDQLDRSRELRREQTYPEKLLWSRLRDHRCGGLKFRRQQVIGPYFADFYCPTLMLVVEIDGESHEFRREHDARRTEHFQHQGIRVIRFTNDDVLQDVDVVAAAIAKFATSQ